MTDHEHFYKKYISLTEWLHGMGHAEAGVMRTEDNDKRERLRVLNELIGLPYDKPYQFTAREAAERTPGFKKFVQEHGQELCAIRLIPLDPALPKLRMRGKTIAEAVGWLDKQNLDHAKYRVDFVPHPHSDIWATIFVVNQHGIFGEIIAGPHNQLTQGFEAGDPPISFSNDFEATLLSRPDQEAARTARRGLRARLPHRLLRDDRLRRSRVGIHRLQPDPWQPLRQLYRAASSRRSRSFAERPDRMYR
jgi:hypothetical protein